MPLVLTTAIKTLSVYRRSAHIGATVNLATLVTEEGAKVTSVGFPVKRGPLHYITYEWYSVVYDDG